MLTFLFQSFICIVIDYVCNMINCCQLLSLLHLKSDCYVGLRGICGYSNWPFHSKPRHLTAVKVIYIKISVL